MTQGMIYFSKAGVSRISSTIFKNSPLGFVDPGPDYLLGLTIFQGILFFIGLVFDFGSSYELYVHLAHCFRFGGWEPRLICFSKNHIF